MERRTSESKDKYSIREPSVSEIDGGFKFDYGIMAIDCRDIYTTRNSAHALIDFYYKEYRVLTGQKVDLNDELKLKPVIDLLNNKPAVKDNLAEVKNTLEDWRTRVIPLHRNQGLEVETISSRSIFPPIEYLVKPLLIKGLPTVIFGDGKTGKSTMSQVAGLIAASGESKLGFETSGKPLRVFFVDYEQTRDTFGYNWQSLQRGLGIDTEFGYMRCVTPLADIAQRLRAELVKGEYDLLIVDSLAYACGGNINEAETANRFWQALKTLPVTTLIIAHNAKGGENGKQKTIYGSVFFHNMARSIWQMEAAHDEGEDSFDCCLTHIDANYSKKFSPMYFNIAFSEGLTTIETRETSETQFADRVALWKQIKEVLTINNGTPMTENEIAAALGQDDSHSIRTTLYKYTKVFTKVGNERPPRWGIVSLQ